MTFNSRVISNVIDDTTSVAEDIDLEGNQIIDSTGDVTVSGRTPALSRSHTVPTSYFSGPAHGEGNLTGWTRSLCATR